MSPGGTLLLLLAGGAGPEPDPDFIACATKDVLKDGLAWLTAMKKAHASEPVIFRRGNQAVALCAEFAPKRLTLTDEFGVRVEYTDMDFLIPAADLKLGGVRVTPQRDDTIKITSPTGGTETYEVLPFGNEAPWRWSDPHGSMIRVHTKRIAEEAIV